MTKDFYKIALNELRKARFLGLNEAILTIHDEQDPNYIIEGIDEGATKLEADGHTVTFEKHNSAGGFNGVFIYISVESR